MAATNRNIPEDLVMDILACVPVKSLLRFRCVSKPWCDLIGNPDFITKQYLKQTIMNKSKGNVFVTHSNISESLNCETMISSLKIDEKDRLTVRETMIIPSHERFCLYLLICGPRNGIICLYVMEPDADDLALWNPATREFKTIPSSKLEPPDTDRHETVFGNIGFGFDHRTNDYNVVRFVTYTYNGYNGTVEQVELFSLNSNSWRVLPAVDVSPWFNTCNTYKDGVYYWWAGKRSDGSQWILSFDMADKVFEKVPLPSEFGIVRQSVFSFFDGKLSLVLYSDDDNDMGKCFDVWVMTKHGVKESWVKQMRIGPILGIEKPLEYWKNGGLFLEDDEGFLVLYDACTREVKKLQICGEEYRSTLQVMNYEESLVPINGVQIQQQYRT
ncbi:F-box and associated interaction domains-containing protein putative isoform 1 [Tripterygium wilfordii]|uniref:F-box and associated interaction domains-containing protein putative isoform 1 n=1 Tax=Tripterygium wilfordii TaxID=458696 RepID=A0A7J7CX71_TRIWF|nr:F-box/kelch-repeat protein At3g06240-like [Tripterygium wilfordii]XP_038719870.1 F-box/kelch-repeat protein At3g06240-like [Tripterygium wilfordii]XP_038719871.1 F-box/kelch-repeat protein At3g06240-like [Tripterygium wilfordii]KAF5738673.1 F-box and associated interaction domains-containing protein putative isoform 1 [Tripterygium wilfordii]